MNCTKIAFKETWVICRFRKQFIISFFQIGFVWSFCPEARFASMFKQTFLLLPRGDQKFTGDGFGDCNLIEYGMMHFIKEAQKWQLKMYTEGDNGYLL